MQEGEVTKGGWGLALTLLLNGASRTRGRAGGWTSYTHAPVFRLPEHQLVHWLRILYRCDAFTAQNLTIPSDPLFSEKFSPTTNIQFSHNPHSTYTNMVTHNRLYGNTIYKQAGLHFSMKGYTRGGRGFRLLVSPVDAEAEIRGNQGHAAGAQELDPGVPVHSADYGGTSSRSTRWKGMEQSEVRRRF